jgi:flagellar protein FlgJ
MKIQNHIPLTQDPAQQKAATEEKLRGAAKMYEQHFLGEMVRAMRATIHREHGLMPPNMAENIFQEKLDDNYVEQWADKGGVGLSDMIYQQLHERIFPQKKDFSKPAGPLPLNKTTTPFQIKVDKRSDGGGQVIFRSAPGAAAHEKTPVQNPWRGTVESAAQDNGWAYVNIRHANELRSQIAYQGQLADLKIGSEVEEGDSIGWLAPDLPTLRWNIEA